MSGQLVFFTSRSLYIYASGKEDRCAGAHSKVDDSNNSSTTDKAKTINFV